MRKVSDVLDAAVDHQMFAKELRDRVGGKASATDEAVNALVAEGCVEVLVGGLGPATEADQTLPGDLIPLGPT